MLLVGKSGRCVVIIRVNRECPSTFNPADFCIHQLAIIPGRETECRQFVHETCDTYEKSPQFEAIMSEIQEIEDSSSGDEVLVGNLKNGSPYKTSWLGQFGPVLWRSWVTNMRDPALLRGRIIHGMFVSVLVGLVYLDQTYDQKGIQNINGCLFLMQVQMTFGNLFAVLNTFLNERTAFLREHHNGMYCVSVYYLCRMLAEMPIFLLMPVVFTTVIYWMIGLYPDAGTYFLACVTLVLVANIAVSFGYLLSCSVDHLTSLMGITPLIIVPLMLFGGFYLNSGSVPPYFLWLQYLSWFSYANECLVVNQWKGVDEIICEFNVTSDTSDSVSTCYPDGQSVITTFGYDEADLLRNYFVMFAILVAFRIISCTVLYVRSRKRE